MSGGVDSSVAALLLRRAGYEVIGVTLRLYTAPDPASMPANRGCCGLEDVEYARRVCQLLGVPHYFLNFEKEFKEHVIAYFVSEYERGRTPNPCLACNDKIKFDFLLRKSLAFGADAIATGHYARVVARTSPLYPLSACGEGRHAVTPSPSTSLRTGSARGLPRREIPHSVRNDIRGYGVRVVERDGDRFRLLKAVDATKDQSYVLYTLGQTELSRLLLPVGGYTKAHLREIAREAGLPNADKPDSQEICFIGAGDYRGFLRQHIPARAGEVVDTEGRTLGAHNGVAGFTIGQRHGLGVAAGRPLYVVALDAASNRVVVGDQERLLATEAVASRVRYVSGNTPDGPMTVRAKYRYRSPEMEAELTPQGERTLVRFRQPQRALTPGQAIVFYRGDEVLGGGVIDEVRAATIPSPELAACAR